MTTLIKVGRYTIDPDNEQRDIHEIDGHFMTDEALALALENFNRQARDGRLDEKAIARAQDRFAPKVHHEVRWKGKLQIRVWDYRDFTRPNGGKIPCIGRVEHIPVIRQMPGRADIDVLWRVLVQQGLMVQNATDNEKNVAYFTNRNDLCFQAKGGNSLLCGTEHMHLLTSDPWNTHQLNASAFLSAGDWKYRRIPHVRGRLVPHPGFVGVSKRGHFTHEEVSRAAGFNDRSDPGDKYEALMGEIRQRAIFFNRHHHF